MIKPRISGMALARSFLAGNKADKQSDDQQSAGCPMGQHQHVEGSRCTIDTLNAAEFAVSQGVWESNQPPLYLQRPQVRSNDGSAGTEQRWGLLMR
jgi:hypothetical protein